MTHYAPPPPAGRDGHPTAWSRTRTRHSANRASAHRSVRARFDRFRESVKGTVNSAQDYAGWNSNTALVDLDSTILLVEEQALRARAEKMIVPRIGSLASSKPEGIWRIAYCQLNNMSGTNVRHQKINDLVRITNEFEVDGIAMCELGVNWSAGRGHSLKSWCSPRFPNTIRCATAHNKHTPRTSLSQPGGTGLILTGPLLDYTRLTEVDNRELGRWTSCKLSHTTDHTTRLVVAYCPCKAHGKASGGLKTVYRQHVNYPHLHGIDRSPYQFFFDDLITQLKTWRADNKRIILCMDLNEHPLTGKLARRLRSDDIELFEQSHLFWPEGIEPNTHVEGSKPIDGIFTTPDIDLTACLLLSFHDSVGDHRTIIFEITTASAIGKYQAKIVRPNSRRLTLRQPGAVQSYNTTTREQFRIHNIHRRLNELQRETASYIYPPPEDFQRKCDRLHTQIAEIRLYAESFCRKILKPELEFSPTTQYWYDRAHAYQLLVKIKSGKMKKYTDVSRAMRFAARKNIPDPRNLSLQQCEDGLLVCRQRQKELKNVSAGLRRQFQSISTTSARLKGDHTRERAIQERMLRERNMNTWKRINQVTRLTMGRTCREVQQSISGVTRTYRDRAGIEQTIQQEISSRFRLGHSAPIGKSLLGDELHYLQDTGTAYDILMGRYKIPSWLDPATQMILREIATLGKALLTGNNKRQITISGQDYIKYWSRVNDRTSSSPSGIHITHYKASAQDPELAERFAQQMNLIVCSGIHPTRWGVALQVMLEKVAGVCLVDKLWSIQLYEADLNWFMKFVFNDIALTQLENAGMLPEEHYSKKGSTSEDACLEKTLTFDVSRQSRTPMATISVDAAQCYDRVHPTLMSLIWLALTNHPYSVVILLQVLQQMKIFTRTAFGDSSTFFGGPDETPLCGLGQGSKAAPASWLQLSSMIVLAYKRAGLASVIVDPITGIQTESIGCMYVDDTDLYCMVPLLTTVLLLVFHAQVCVSMWSNLLRATGGAIKGPKSFWYLVDYRCKNGVWDYASLDENDVTLTLADEETGEDTILERKSVDEATKTLGVLQSPAGDHMAQMSHMRDKAFDWLNKIKNGHLPSSMVWLSYNFQLWPKLRYGLGTLSNSYSAAETCLDKFDYQLLPHIGVNRNIKKELRTLHCTFGGCGLLSLPIEQFLCRSALLLQHYNTDSIIGRKLSCSLHLLQLQIGTNVNPLTLPYKTYGHLAPHSWISQYWESLEIFLLSLHMEYTPVPPPREHDSTIMIFLQRFLTTPAAATSVNGCRCALHALFLSDITTADGRTIDLEILHHAGARRASKFLFPLEEPTKLDWLVWSDTWIQALGRHLLLPQPLRKWTNPSHVRWRWYYDCDSDTILEDTGSIIHRFSNQDTRTLRTRSGGVYTMLPEPATAITGMPALCVAVPGKNIARLSLRNVGPQLSVPSKLPASFWDILTDLGGEWMWQQMHFDLDTSVEWFLAALTSGGLLWVTDGSYNPIISNISGAGWIVKDTMSQRRWACSFYEVSDTANSYRAELLGLYSIHVFILALSKFFDSLHSSTVNLRCNNKGALRTSSRKLLRIRPTSKCADILRAFCTLRSALIGVHIHYAHVPAHMDDLLKWDDLTLEQQLNVQCDALAKHAAAQAYNTSRSGEPHTHTTLLPLEQTAMFIGGQKLCSDISTPLRFKCSRIKACKFLGTHRGWSQAQFDEVCWPSLDAALASKTTGFKVWLAKQHSNFCATRVQLHRAKQAEDNKCPSCQTAAEDADHLCRCPNAERTQLLHDSTSELEAWMSAHDHTHHELCYWVPHYILCRGQVRFADLGPMSPEMMQIASSQDTIGWRNFMEGRISKRIFTLQRAHLVTSGSRLSPQRWMSTFISHILHITHSQWIFRNFMLHDKADGYLRLKEVTDATIQIDSLMQVRPSSIPADSHFLLEFDTERLLTADSDTQQYWISAMQAALAARTPSQPDIAPPMGPHRNRHYPSQCKTAHSIRQI